MSVFSNCVFLSLVCMFSLAMSDNSTSTHISMLLSFMNLPVQMKSILPLLGQYDMKTTMSLLSSLLSQFPGMLSQNLKDRKDDLSENTFHCLSDINTYIKALLTGEMWALSMFDATGKLGPSLLQGSLTFMGNFDQCLKSVAPLNQTTGRQIRGDTCVVSFLPPQAVLSIIDSEVHQKTAFSEQLVFNWHLCVPNSCDNTSMKIGLQDMLLQFNMSITSVVCHNDIKGGQIGKDPAAVGVIVLIAVLCFLLLLGSALDLCLRAISSRANHGTNITEINNASYSCQQPMQNSVTSLETNESTREPEREKGASFENKLQPSSENSQLTNSKAPLWHRVLLCFSAVTNGEKILSVRSTPGSLTCLNGIRVLSMGWVIFGHTLSVILPVSVNPRAYIKLLQSFTFQVMLNGTVSVDSFFVLSGTLVTYLFLRETAKRGRVQPKQMVMYYVHRYLRLTPAYAFVIFINTCLAGYFADGPTYTGTGDKEVCQKNWWMNILYVNNFVGPTQQCIGWTWYLANDMQFYIVAPLALIPFSLGCRRGGTRLLRYVGVGITVLFIVVHIACSAYLVYTYDVDILSPDNAALWKVYITPYCRIAPFAIGILAAFVLHRTHGKIKLSPFLQTVGWLVSLSILLTVLLVTYDEYGPEKEPWNSTQLAIHTSLYRPAWGLMLAWIIVMCCSGKGGILNSALSWDWWQPLSRLTYGAYLLHMMMMFIDANSVKTLVQFSIPYGIHRFFGYMVLSYLLSFLMALLVEAPFLQLEKVILG